MTFFQQLGILAALEAEQETGKDAMRHTPGPWKVQKGSSCYHAVSEDGYLSTGCISFDGRGLANARLIAAAPDLLALLVELKASHYGAAVREEYEERVEAAIKKATGAVKPQVGSG